MIASLFKASNIIGKIFLSYYLVISTIFFFSEKNKLLKERGLSFTYFNLAMIMAVTVIFLIELVFKTIFDIQRLVYIWEKSDFAGDLSNKYNMFINPLFDFIILSSFIYLFYLVGKVNDKG